MFCSLFSGFFFHEAMIEISWTWKKKIILYQYDFNPLSGCVFFLCIFFFLFLFCCCLCYIQPFECKFSWKVHFMLHCILKFDAFFLLIRTGGRKKNHQRKVYSFSSFVLFFFFFLHIEQQDQKLGKYTPFHYPI